MVIDARPGLASRTGPAVFCPVRRTLSAAATRDPAPLALGCPSPHTVVDVVFERELEALRSYGALGTIMASDFDTHSIFRKEDGGRKLSAPGVKHPGGCQIVGKPFLLPFAFVHVRLLCCRPGSTRRPGDSPAWSVDVRVMTSKCHDFYLSSGVKPAEPGSPDG